MAISVKIAQYIRFERGLALPPDREYTNPRVAEIARLQAEAFANITNLDIELLELSDE